MQGVIAAVPTPVDTAFHPQKALFLEHCQWALANGCDGLNILGSTGEANSLSIQARRDVMGWAAAALPKTRLMVGTGTPALAETIALTEHADDLGYSVALVLPPYYYTPASDAGLIAWYMMLIGRRDVALMQARRAREGRLFGMATGLMHLAFLQILLGALVAGIDAGRGFTDWPLMAGGFFPPEPFSLSPLWRNFFEDAGLVQFMHRMAGYLLLIYGIVVWRRSRQSGTLSVRGAFAAAMVMLVVQVLIGIVTVMYSAPLSLAIFHQLGGIVLWVLILRARFNAGYPAQQSVRG